MPRAGYSQQQAGRMLTLGRVFEIVVSETPQRRTEYAIVTGRCDGVVYYSFFDSPGSNEMPLGRLYPRIVGIEDVRKDDLRKIEEGWKVGTQGQWISPEEQRRESEEDLRRAMAYKPT